MTTLALPRGTTLHAIERVEERLTTAGWSPTNRKALFEFLRRYASTTHPDSEAVRVAVLPEDCGDKASYGSEVWAIYRERELVTVMLRESWQKDSRLRCVKVTRLV